MSQPIRPEVWNEAVLKKDPGLLPNKKTRDLFKGNGGIKINEGEICRLTSMQISDYITDYDDRRINGLAQGATGFNADGRDGWGASAFGVFQNVMFTSEAFAMSRHRSLAYRLFEEAQFSGNIGEWGTATTSNYESGGQALKAIASQISELKSRVDQYVIGPDMDHYNMAMACNGRINGRVVSKPGYVDKIFNGDCATFDWVAEPGPFAGTPLPPKFAPIQCMEMDFESLMTSLHDLRNAWAACGIDYTKCIICIDPDYRLEVMQAITGKGIPVLESTKKMIEDGPGNELKINGFTFDFDVDPSSYPSVYVDANLNVVHTQDGTAAFDQYINSYTPSTTDKNPMRKKLIASYRMGVGNYVKTVWDATTKKFVKEVTNYPLGDPSSADYYGNAEKVPFENYNKATTYPHDHNAGKGLPWHDETVPTGYTKATGPISPISKRKVVGLALFPEAVALSQEYSAMYTDEGNTRGKFTEICWDIKYDCWVIPELAAGVVPILNVNANHEWTIPVSVKKMPDVTVDKITNKVKIDSSVSDPVHTKEVT